MRDEPHGTENTDETPGIGRSIKKDTAIVFGITGKLTFALANILTGLQRHSPGFGDDIIVFYDQMDEAERDLIREIDSRVVFRPYTREYVARRMWGQDQVPDNAGGLFTSYFRRFTHMPLACFEVFDLLRDYRHVLNLEVDMLVLKDISFVKDYAPIAWRASGVKLVLHDPKTRETGKPLPEPLARKLVLTRPNGGMVFVTDRLPDHGELTAAMYSIPVEYGACVKFPVHWSLAEGSFGILATLREWPVSVVPMQVLNTLTTERGDRSSWSLMHSMGSGKFWNDPVLRLCFPEWEENDAQWRKKVKDDRAAPRPGIDGKAPGFKLLAWDHNDVVAQSGNVNRWNKVYSDLLHQCPYPLVPGFERRHSTLRLELPGVPESRDTGYRIDFNKQKYDVVFYVGAGSPAKARWERYLSTHEALKEAGSLFTLVKKGDGLRVVATVKAAELTDTLGRLAALTYRKAYEFLGQPSSVQGENAANLPRDGAEVRPFTSAVEKIVLDTLARVTAREMPIPPGDAWFRSVVDHLEELELVRVNLGDEASKEEFDRVIAARIASGFIPMKEACATYGPVTRLQWDGLMNNSREKLPKDIIKDNRLPGQIHTWIQEQYRYKDLCVVRPGDTVMDCGAFTGDTSMYFSRLASRSGRVYAFEAGDKTSRDLVKNMKEKGLANVVVAHLAVSDKKGVVRFSGNTVGGHISNSGTIEVSCDTLDHYAQEKGLKRIDFIKMDIEGAEMGALDGARNTIQTHHPKMALCVYHKPNDLFDIFNKVRDINPHYDFYFRHVSVFRYESILYCVPRRSGGGALDKLKRLFFFGQNHRQVSSPLPATSARATAMIARTALNHARNQCFANARNFLIPMVALAKESWNLPGDAIQIVPSSTEAMLRPTKDDGIRFVWKLEDNVVSFVCRVMSKRSKVNAAIKEAVADRLDEIGKAVGSGVKARNKGNGMTFHYQKPFRRDQPDHRMAVDEMLGFVRALLTQFARVKEIEVNDIGKRCQADG